MPSNDYRVANSGFGYGRFRWRDSCTIRIRYFQWRNYAIEMRLSLLMASRSRVGFVHSSPYRFPALLLTTRSCIMKESQYYWEMMLTSILALMKTKKKKNMSNMSTNMILQKKNLPA